MLTNLIITHSIAKIIILKRLQDATDAKQNRNYYTATKHEQIKP